MDFVGFILPFFIDLVNKFVADSRAKFAIAMAICFLVALVLNFDQFNNLQWEEVMNKGSFLFAQAQLTYNLYWKKSTPRTKMLGIK